MRKRIIGSFALLCCALLLTGCMNSPPDALLRQGGDGQRLISASIGELTPDARKITLYFRYGD